MREREKRSESEWGEKKRGKRYRGFRLSQKRDGHSERKVKN